MSTFKFPKIVFGPEFDAVVDGVKTRVRIEGGSNGAYLIKNMAEGKVYRVKPGLALNDGTFTFEGAISTPVDPTPPEPDPDPSPDPDPTPDPEETTEPASEPTEPASETPTEP